VGRDLNSIALMPAQSASRAFSGVVKGMTRHVRWTVAISIILIFGSFISAAVIQMRRDRAHALDQAAFIETRRAQEIASDFSATLDRYAALGAAFANAQSNTETSAALSEAGGPVLQNIAVLDGSGRPLFELKHAPKDLVPLDTGVLAAAANRRIAFSANAGANIVLGFPQNRRVVLVQLAARELFPQASMEDDLLATRDGRVLAIGRNWRELPSPDALALGNGAHGETRALELPSGRRLIALLPVPQWPVIAGASVEVGEALSAWYGALPLYFFFILGPAFAGAGLAVVFVREFERRTRPHSADRLLKAKRNEEARLLIRLADAERRAAEAERSKSEFITHMSHELRTPLNAIIGFSEMIEQELFGKPSHPKYEEYAHDIHEAGQKLHARINEILEFANLETGKQPIGLTPVDASALVRHAVGEIAGRAFSRRIRFALSIPDSTQVLADAKALHRALNNLLANALQYTRDGSLVRVQIRAEDETFAILVQDNGVGFSAAEGAHTGEPFARFDRSGRETGLGIAIACSLVRRMGGALNISGDQGTGAVAEIRLRRA
jgi:signal transduction histidine kinase